MVRSAPILLSLALLLPATAHGQAYRIFQTFAGRYHRRQQWTDSQVQYAQVTRHARDRGIVRGHHHGARVIFPPPAQQPRRRNLSLDLFI
jgi:hypothetical protein